jgi:hypothetical protein
MVVCDSHYVGVLGCIVGGAILPKLMGHIADVTDLSRSFIVPTVCFAFCRILRIQMAKIQRSGMTGWEPSPLEAAAQPDFRRPKDSPRMRHTLDANRLI